MARARSSGGGQYPAGDMIQRVSIDIKSEEEKRQEVEQQMSLLVSQSATPLDAVPGLGEGLVEKLTAAGITTVEALADMTPEQLEAIEGIGPKTVEKISLAVNNYFSSLEAGEGAAVVVEGETAEGAVPAEALEQIPVAEGNETSADPAQPQDVAVEELAAQADSAGEPSAQPVEPASEGGEALPEQEEEAK